MPCSAVTTSSSRTSISGWCSSTGNGSSSRLFTPGACSSRGVRGRRGSVSPVGGDPITTLIPRSLATSRAKGVSRSPGATTTSVAPVDARRSTSSAVWNRRLTATSQCRPATSLRDGRRLGVLRRQDELDVTVRARDHVHADEVADPLCGGGAGIGGGFHRSDVATHHDSDIAAADLLLSLIHISEPTRRTPISYAVF